MLKLVNQHKTKLLGALLVILGALQANSSTIQGLVPPKAYAWGTVVIGCLVALLGFLNQGAQS